MSGFGRPRRNRGERNAHTPGEVSIGPGASGRAVTVRSSAAESASATVGPTAAGSCGKVP